MGQNQSLENDREMINNLIIQKTQQYTQAITQHKPFGEAQHLRLEIKELDKKLHGALKSGSQNISQ